MTKLKRKNHFLPKCYQEGFADDLGKVWVKFGNKSEPQYRNPETIGRLRSFYVTTRNGVESDKVENFLSEKVENAFATVSQRIKKERERFVDISGTEEGVICNFVSSQAVRTLAFKRCIEEQAGRPVDTNTFLQVSGKQMWTMTDFWIKNPPTLRFYTSLPHVSERFITGDSPVLVIQINNNPIWVPTYSPNLSITDLPEILKNPRHSFWVSLSPYVCVAIHAHGDGEPHLPPATLDPQRVRRFNDFIRGQSESFVLARDKESLL